MVLLFIIFIAVVLIVGKVWGITSLFGMGFSFLIIFKFILPQIINGANPILIAIIGSLFIIPVTFYLSHGFNKKTHIAIVSTVIALIITGVLAGFFVNAARLTGFASEEAGFLQAMKGGTVNIKGLLMAGIIIGALGILDDVTVSQASVVQQLKNTSSKLSGNELYKKAMRVGQDHVSSMVNTLVLVYTGVALPLLLLFIDSPRSFSEIVNYELIADEIVRILVGSIGLVLAVPIATVLACRFLKTEKQRKVGEKI
ncbi:YibE/F family protein [Patescibacteria group bacterium]|nr:YibE/F family protein [Patescibacteria group bacterium]